MSRIGVLSCGLICVSAWYVAAAEEGVAGQPLSDDSEIIFPIVCFLGPPANDNVREHWQRIKEANFRLVLPSHQYDDADQTKMLDHCRAVGLRGIVNVKRLAPPGSGGLPTDDWRQRIREAVDRFAKHPALHGYMVRDEPGADLYPQLGRVVAQFGRLDPRHTVAINLFPVHATPEQMQTDDYVDYLERYLRTVKPPFLSYDHYPLLRDGSDRPDFFLNLELARAAGAKYKTPVWTVVLSGWGQHFRKPTPAELRWQVYGALAYGVKGVAYFAYWPANDGYTSVVDYKGRPQSLYKPMAKLNAKVLAMGRILFDATSTAVYHSGTSIPRGCRRLDLEAAPLAVPSEVPLVVGLFNKGPKGRYAMIANRNYRRPVTLPVTVRPQVQKTSLLTTSGSAFRPPSEARTIEITLPAGGATLLQLHMHAD